MDAALEIESQVDGTLLEIGAGRMAPEVVDRVLKSGDRRLAGATAPPRGLCLWRIDYHGDAEAGT